MGHWFESNTAHQNIKIQFIFSNIIFLMSADNNSFISSNLVKEVHKLGGDVSKFVSENTIKILNNKNTSS